MFCGIDWAERHHEITLVDEHGELVAKRRIHETVDGWQQLRFSSVENNCLSWCSTGSAFARDVVGATLP
nr:IS110 family transposase [Micromonospora craniellae]